MKLTNREGKITVDGQFDLTLIFRNGPRESAITIDRDEDALPCAVNNFNMQFVTQKTRVGRFFHIVKLAWQYSK